MNSRLAGSPRNTTRSHAGACPRVLGRGQPYDQLPYFYSDQYDVGMEYGLAARLLAHAAASDEGGSTRRALRAAAEALGRKIAAVAGDLETLLRERGYEPFDDGGVTRLRNCPFHAVARTHPEVVCDMNLRLLSGLLDGLRAGGAEAALDPGPGRCCVAIKRR